MLKILKLASMVSVAAFVLIGCGGSGEKSKASIVNHSSKAVSVAGLKSLEKTSNIKNLSNSNLKNTAENAEGIKSEDADAQCKTGKIEIQQSETSLSMNAIECNDGESTVNGALSVKFNQSQTSNSGTLSITRDMTLDDSENAFFIKKGAQLSVNMNQIGETSSIKIMSNFQSALNGITLNCAGLDIDASVSDDNIKVTFNAGEFNIAEYYFKIDASEDNSIIINDNVSSGTISMTDGAGHKVELEVSDAGVVIKIDENGDGIFSENEILN